MDTDERQRDAGLDRRSSARHRRLNLVLLGCLLLMGAMEQPAAKVSGAIDASALKQGKSGRLAVVMTIPDRYHAQSHTPVSDDYIKCDLTLDAMPGVKYGEIVYPAGVDHTYPDLGKLNVYEGTVVIIVPFEVDAGATVGDAQLGGSVILQMCNDSSCFAPAKLKFSVPTKIVGAGDHVEPMNGELFKAPEPATRP